jgi:acetoin utilization deacetylase AcuC-like enzyme
MTQWYWDWGMIAITFAISNPSAPQSRQTDTSLLPATWPAARGHVSADYPAQIRLGLWARDTFSSVGRGTYMAAAESVDCVLSALDYVLRGGAAAFALSRPPHHHAGRNYLNGYCYLNGTATAALRAQASGLRCAVLDIDYHHGNGTQDILYDTDVLFCSIHGQPNHTFPFFSGYADECGAGRGEEYTFNLPLPHGTAWPEYANALGAAVRRIVNHGPDLLIVSLGVDTYCADPVGRFRLQGNDFSKIGMVIAGITVPTVFVMEGGYALDALGSNVANVLCGWEATGHCGGL